MSAPEEVILPSASDELYNLQLQLKQHKVNKNRKAAEIKRLHNNFEKQIQNLLVDLYSSAKIIWTFLTRDPASTDFIRLSIKETPSTPQNSERISDYLSNLRNDPTAELQKIPPNSKCLPKELFLTILSLFNFCWSSEQVDAFSSFVIHTQPQYQHLVAQCAIIQPILQTFFSTSLKPVFDSIFTKDVSELSSLLLSSFTSNASLMPSFLSIILKGTKNPSHIFFVSFLEPILQNFDIFSLAHSELVIFAGNKLQSLITEIGQFFNSNEGNEFVLNLAKISTEKGTTALIPSEDLLAQVYKHYQPMTLFQQGHKLLFIPLSSLSPSSYGQSSTEIKTLPGLVRKFLLRAELIRVEGDYPTPLDYFKQLSMLSSVYGEPKLEAELDNIAIALQSSPSSDSSDISSLSILAPPSSNSSSHVIRPSLKPENKKYPCLTIHDIAREVEIEFLTSNNSELDPLIQIAKYSSQHQFLNKINELIKILMNEAQKKIDFQVIRGWANLNLADQIPPPSSSSPNSGPGSPSSPSQPFGNSGSNPNMAPLDERAATFKSYFLNISQRVAEALPEVSTEFNTQQCIHTLIMEKYNLLADIRSQKSRENDNKLHDYIQQNKQLLLNQQQNSFLQIYKDDPSLLSLFDERFKKAITSEMPFQGLYWLNEAYSVLENLLTIQDMKEIGADQILPMSIVAMVLSNPIGLHTFEKYLELYLMPLTTDKSPVDHSVEYSVAQYMSFYHFIVKEVDLEKD